MPRTLERRAADASSTTAASSDLEDKPRVEAFEMQVMTTCTRTPPLRPARTPNPCEPRSQPAGAEHGVIELSGPILGTITPEIHVNGRIGPRRLSLLVTIH